MATRSKYEQEYTNLRNKIMRKQRTYLNKGYSIEEPYKLPTFKQLESAPSKREIEKLKRINEEEIYKKLKIIIPDTATGDLQEISAKEAKHLIRQRAAKQAAETRKRKKDFDKWEKEQFDYGGDFYESEITDEDWFDDYWDSMQRDKEKGIDLDEEDDFPEEYDLPFKDTDVDTSFPVSTDIPFEEDLILEFTLQQIQRLYTFESKDQNKKRGEEWENHLFDIGEQFTNHFLNLMQTDKKELALRCYIDSEKIVSLISKIEYSYRTFVSEDDLLADFYKIINGSISESESKQLGGQYDSPEDGDIND